MPEPVLVGRNENKLKTLADAHSLSRYSTDLDACLSDSANQIYFDAQLTNLRAAAVRRAIAARKAIYCEKPTATNVADAVTLYREVREAGLKNGVVQDKLFLPGLLKLKYLVDTDFLAASYRYAGSLVTGFLTVSASPLSAPPGITKRRRVAA